MHIVTDRDLLVPSMKLRLMGLRCTNLVSTKKPDTRAFFGLQSLKVDGETSNKVGERITSEPASRTPRHENDELSDSDVRGGETEYPVLHDEAYKEGMHETTPDMALEVEKVEQRWDCPICSRPQPADERRFNDHLDSCLSRQTIRDAVQRDTTESPPLPSEPSATKKIKGSGEKKRRPVGFDDPKQKKLCFG